MAKRLDQEMVLKGNSLPDIILTIFDENLLNEDIYFPSINRNNINSIPSEGGRAIYGRLNIKF